MYNTNRPLAGIEKDVTSLHELNNVVYGYYFGSNYIGRTSQRFHVRCDQHDTKVLKNVFNGET